MQVFLGDIQFSLKSLNNSHSFSFQNNNLIKRLLQQAEGTTVILLILDNLLKTRNILRVMP